jgi:riboflavin biosynthesis pyrimidine reductase
LGPTEEYAKIWQAADKIVYSRSLEDLATARTRLEREFDANAIQQLKAATARDIWVGGPTLAAQALKLGFVDECDLFLSRVVVGGGTPALPDRVRLELELLDERRFGKAWCICITGSRRDENPHLSETWLALTVSRVRKSALA